MHDEIDRQIAEARREKEQAIDDQDFARALAARDREKELVHRRALIPRATWFYDPVGRPNMFERFTDRARRIVVLAQEEARMLNHNYIGTEHILLGMIHEGEGVAAKALESLGISLEGVRAQVEEIIGRGQQVPTGHIPFTDRGKKVMELSLREALQLGHNYIGTEHLLLGLIREGEGVAAQVLVKLGAELTRVRQQVIQLLSGYQGKATAEAQTTMSDDEGEKVTLTFKTPPEVSAERKERLRASYEEVLADPQPEREARARATYDLINQAYTIIAILNDHDIEPNPTLVTQLIEWKEGPDGTDD